MGQVPQGQKSYTLIGSGRLAKHLTHFFKHKQFTVYNWSRSDDPEFNSLPVKKGQSSNERLQILAEKTSHILLAIKDEAIQFYADKYSHDHSIIHFSGSFFCENSIGLHPLMTFSNELYSTEFYDTIPFIIDQPITLSDVMPGLINPFYNINETDKALYHCLCSMGGNFLQLLLKPIITKFNQKFNFPERILEPYLLKAIENCLSNPEAEITGPLSRNDKDTIAHHKKTLQGTAELELYTAFENYFNLMQDKKKSL